MAADGRSLGAMISVGLSEHNVTRYLSSSAQKLDALEVEVGCINSPDNVTLSGDVHQIDALESRMREDGVFVRRLPVKVAYHSPHMSRIAEDYRNHIQNIESGIPTQTAMISSVTGRRVQRRQLKDANYWVENMILPVQFSKAVGQLCSPPAKKQRKMLGQPIHDNIVASDLLEIGPHSALRGPIRDVLHAIGRSNDISYLTTLDRNLSAMKSFLEAIGHLFSYGYDADLLEANGLGSKAHQSQPLLTDLPKYPFNHSNSYWLESRFRKNTRFRKEPKNDLLGIQSSDWNALVPQWRNVIRSKKLPWIEDHKVDYIALPSATYPLTIARFMMYACTLQQGWYQWQ